MNIQLTNAGKRFNRDWIFRHLDYNFKQGVSYAITGPNGSGKSTLLQTIAGAIAPSEGKIEYFEHTIKGQPATSEPLSTETEFNNIAIVAPYLEVIEEMTATEFLHFHASFKPFMPAISVDQMLEIVGLKVAAHKQIRYYSSGMKQRIKLAQAIFSDVPVLLLDEPCTNFDTSGYALYHHLIKNYCQNKLIVVSSNDVNEFDFCVEKLSILDYK